MKYLKKAIQFMNLAYEYDDVEDSAIAIKNYQEALDCFKRSLGSGETKTDAIKEKVEENIESCKNRISELEFSTVNEKPNSKIVYSKNIEQKDKIKLSSDICHEKTKDDEVFERLKSKILCERPTINFSDVCGMENEIEDLKRTIQMPVEQPTLFSNTSRYKGFLFYGPPGTGKTHLARAVAGATNSTFILITTADIVSKYVGESEKLIQALFEIARENSPTIIFFDEIDSFACSNSDTDNESRSSVKNQLLSEMDGFNQNKGVFVMATTNHPNRLDSALLRRFNKLIYVPLPDETARQKMFKHYYAVKGFSDEDFITWAQKTKKFSGADIERVFIEAEQLPIKRLQRASYFRRKFDQNSLKPIFEPCSSGDLGAIEMTYEEIPHDCLSAEITVTFNDVIESIKHIKPTAKIEDIRRLEKFTEANGWQSSGRYEDRVINKLNFWDYVASCFELFFD